MSEIKKYRAELDAVLLRGDPKQLKEFMRQHGLPALKDDVIEVTFHKAITASTTLPLHYRQQSKAWLTEHHYHSLDDGDV